MNSDALRLLDEMHEAALTAFPTVFHPPNNYVAAYDQLRALLSAQEPTAEHWRRAITEAKETMPGMRFIEERARELAKQEAK